MGALFSLERLLFPESDIRLFLLFRESLIMRKMQKDVGKGKWSGH